MVWVKQEKGIGNWNPLRLLRYLLQENGDYLLQEDEYKIGLEWFWNKGDKNTGNYTKIEKSGGTYTKTAKATGVWTKVPK